MGDIADAMLDGTLCAGCGVALECSEDVGIPMYCTKGCAEDHGADKGQVCTCE